MKAIWFSLILVCWSLSASAADFILETGGGPPGSTRFEVVAQGDRITVIKLSLPMTSAGMTKTSISKVLSPKIAGQLQELANSCSDFRDGCDSVVDGTNARLTIAGKVKGECTGASRWPKGSHTSDFLKAINSNLPKEFQVF